MGSLVSKPPTIRCDSSERHAPNATPTLHQNGNSHVVEEAQADAKQHVDDAEDHGHLHLEGVEEGQLIGSNVPDLPAPERTRGITKNSQREEYCMSV